jgi:hypothetical protein
MARQSLLTELVGFLKENKKWWMIPIILVLGMIAGLLLLAATSPAVAPFIYTLF